VVVPTTIDPTIDPARNPMRRITTSIPSKALIGCIAAATLALAACGGSDDPEPAQPSPTDAPSSDSASEPQADADQAGAGDSADTGAADASGGGEIIDQLDEGMGGGLDEALYSLPDGAILGIVADQLGDDVDVEIEGADIRLTLNEGSTDDAIMDCSIAGAFVEGGEIVTVIYPDGDVTCGE
jgi:hypothetical protein